jgi:phosphate transport system protein
MADNDSGRTDSLRKAGGVHPHLSGAFRELKKSLFTLSAMVEENLRLAIKAVRQGDSDLADQVRIRDLAIDQMEVDFEEECLKILALYQPVAIDLRFVIAVLKINNDLERIGDLAVNIAEHARTMAGTDTVDTQGRLPRMADRAQSMLHDSLDSVVNLDASLARQVLSADDAVDSEFHALIIETRKRLRDGAPQIDDLLSLMVICKHLERIADLTTNIAEDAIYTVDGEIVRHGRKLGTDV